MRALRSRLVVIAALFAVVHGLINPRIGPCTRTSFDRWSTSRLSAAEADSRATTASDPTSTTADTLLDPAEAAKFTILTCASKSCATKRQGLGMDEYSTFSAFYTRAGEERLEVTVEEAPCLGACQLAPVVGIEHADYEGTVALLGMDDAEFAQRLFHRVIDESDADRVWTAVKEAIRVMSEKQEED